MTIEIERRKVYEVSAGNLVRRDEVGPWYLKAERDGKDFVHHYLVQVHPRPETDDELRLVYLDPDEELIDSGKAAAIVEGPAGAAARPGAGDLFVNGRGAFLMVRDTAKAQKMFAFVGTDGRFARRQDRDVRAVHPDWRLDPAILNG